MKHRAHSPARLLMAKDFLTSVCGVCATGGCGFVACLILQSSHLQVFTLQLPPQDS